VGLLPRCNTFNHLVEASLAADSLMKIGDAHFRVIGLALFGYSLRPINI